MSRFWGKLCAIALSCLAATTCSADISYVDNYVLKNPNGSASNPPNFGDMLGEPAMGGQVVGHNAHALLWTTTGTVVDLNPAGYASSWSMATDGHEQGGYGHLTSSSFETPLLWTNSAASAINMLPAGYSAGEVDGVNGGVQVGNASKPASTLHAMLWSGSAASAVDLNPSWAAGASIANAVANGVEVGQAAKSNTAGYQAILWRGTAASAVDLTPAGYSASFAVATDGHQVAGDAFAADGQDHAMLWDADTAAYVDLHPANLTESLAEGVAGGIQVGFGDTDPINGNYHALLWRGTADSVVDLQSVLPGNFVTSEAFGTDGLHVYGLAVDTNGFAHSITWVVPEPSTALLGACLILPALRRTRRGRPGVIGK